MKSNRLQWLSRNVTLNSLAMRLVMAVVDVVEVMAMEVATIVVTSVT